MINEKIMEVVDIVQKQYPKWRKGQTLFNILPVQYQELIRATKNDPFHIDSKIPECLN